MSEKKHTPEPWRVTIEKPGMVFIGSPFGFVVGDVHEANAARIVQCVNACAGIEDPQGAIEKLTVAAKTLYKLMADDAVDGAYINNEAFGIARDALSALAPKEAAVKPLIVQYTALLHKYRDPLARPVVEFRERHVGDTAFQRRAEVLDKLFALSGSGPEEKPQ